MVVHDSQGTQEAGLMLLAVIKLGRGAPSSGGDEFARMKANIAALLFY